MLKITSQQAESTELCYLIADDLCKINLNYVLNIKKLCYLDNIKQL